MGNEGYLGMYVVVIIFIFKYCNIYQVIDNVLVFFFLFEKIRRKFELFEIIYGIYFSYQFRFKEDDEFDF